MHGSDTGHARAGGEKALGFGVANDGGGSGVGGDDAALFFRGIEEVQSLCRYISGFRVDHR
jgi:hypothetical protein